MAETIVWAALVALLVLLIVWRVDRLLNGYLRAHGKQREVATGEADVALAERRVRLEISQRTIEEAAELERAKLAQQTTEAKVAASLADELREDRLEAERAVIVARATAKEDLADEFARESHKARTGADPVAQYERHMETTAGRGLNYMNFDDFVKALRQEA